jgi:hypothetical protein
MARPHFDAAAGKFDALAGADFGSFAGFGLAVAPHFSGGNGAFGGAAALGQAGGFEQIAQGDVLVVFEIKNGVHGKFSLI